MAVYHFFWGTFCDWFLELIKNPLKSEDQKLGRELATVAALILDQSLRLLHPFMPFLSEELWQKLAPRQGALLPQAKFPQPLPDKIQADLSSAEARIEAVLAIVEKVRQIRKESGIAENVNLERASLYSSDQGLLEQVDKIVHYAANLTKISKFGLNDGLEKEKGIAKGITRFRDLKVIVDFKGVVDLQKERQRQEKELARLNNGLAGTVKMLNNAEFVAKAPPELLEEKRESEATYRKKIQEVEEALKLL